MIAGLDHVQLAMPRGQEGAARAFGVELLGLVEVAKPGTLAGRGGIWLGLPDHRQLHYGIEDDFKPNRKAHPALTTPRLDELAETLSAAGYPVMWDDCGMMHSPPGVDSTAAIPLVTDWNLWKCTHDAAITSEFRAGRH